MTVPSENKSYFRVLYSPDGSHVACGMSNAEVRILDSTTGAQVGRSWICKSANIALATAERKQSSKVGNVEDNLKAIPAMQYSPLSAAEFCLCIYI